MGGGGWGLGTSMVVYSGTREVPSATKLRSSELWRRPYDNRMWSEVGENCEPTHSPPMSNRVGGTPLKDPLLPSYPHPLIPSATHSYAMPVCKCMTQRGTEASHTKSRGRTRVRPSSVWVADLNGREAVGSSHYSGAYHLPKPEPQLQPPVKVSAHPRPKTPDLPPSPLPLTSRLPGSTPGARR